jgi:hypothetical protein
VLSAITNPNVALILMMIGIYGLIFEFMNPGALYPGTIGAISLMVGLYALAALPVNIAGVGLIVLGLALMVAEAFAPSFGILGIGGVVAFVLGATILVEPGIPGFEIAWQVVAVVAVTSLALHRPDRASGDQLVPPQGRDRRTLDDRRRGRGAGLERSQGPCVRPRRALAGGLGHAARQGPAGTHNRDRRPHRHRRARPSRRSDGNQLAENTHGNFRGLCLLDRHSRHRHHLPVGGDQDPARVRARRGVHARPLHRRQGPGPDHPDPYVQQMVRVDLRVLVLDVPSQDVISRDNVSVRVNAVLYFRVVDPERATIQVENFMNATSQLAQTTLRSVLGKHELDEMLAERDKLNNDIQEILDSQTDAWGIKVANVEIKHVDISETMIRAIARQAEAERERRGKVINAEGEQQAAAKLLEAAEILSGRPEAMQLRYLSTLNVIAAEKNSTIVFPFPMEFVQLIPGMGGIGAKPKPPETT